jgi:hypothetical protein
VGLATERISTVFLYIGIEKFLREYISQGEQLKNMNEMSRRRDNTYFAIMLPGKAILKVLARPVSGL